MKLLHQRKAIIGLLAALLLTLGVALSAATPASAATAAPAPGGASAFQDKVLDSALANVPGGTRISAGEVKWEGTGIILTVSTPGATSSPTCLGGYFCAFSAKNFKGDCAVAMPDDDFTYEVDWAAYSGPACGGLGTWSWENFSGVRVWKEQYFSGYGPTTTPYTYVGGTPSGNNWCISNGDTNSDVTDKISRTAGWIYMSTNTASC